MPVIFPEPLFSGDAIPLVLNFWQTQPDPAATPPVTGVPLNLTGKKVGVTVKNQPTDDDTAAQFKQDLVGDTTGRIAFAITGLGAGIFWLDVKMWDASNVRSPVIAPQQFTVEQSITDRTTPSP